MPRPRTVILVQARMGSSRLPGKMLLPLAGRPLLAWVLAGAGAARLANQVVLCTSVNPENDALAELAAGLGVAVFRGSEDDVLGRFVAAGRLHRAVWVVRVCGDNPFVNGGEIDRLVAFFGEHACDYACNHVPRQDNGYPDGLGAEITTLARLEEAAQESQDPRDREHVTRWLVERPERFSLGLPQAPPEIAFPQVKLDIDTPEDHERMSRLAQALTQRGQDPQDAVAVCRLWRELLGPAV
ncbi:MAG: NTP transferase domain-containing protein [Pseudomonadota bacterium]